MRRRWHPLRRTALRASLLVGVAGACGGIGLSGEPRQPPPVPGQAIVTWVAHPEGRSVADLSARNDSQDTYRFTAVVLESCENLQGRCGSHPVDVVLSPGQARVLLRVRAAHPMHGFFFNWTYSAVVF